MLYVVNEMTFSGYIVYNLDLLYIIVILLGMFVIITRNPNKFLGVLLPNSGNTSKLWYQPVVEKLVKELTINV